MYEIKKVNVLSVAKISAGLGLAISLAAVLVILFFLLLALVYSGGRAVSPIPAFVWILVMPLVYTGIAFLSGLVSGAAYNLIARWLGGIELEIALKEEEKK